MTRVTKFGKNVDIFKCLERTDFRRLEFPMTTKCFLIQEMIVLFTCLLEVTPFSLTTWHEITNHSPKAFQTTIEFPIHFGPQRYYLLVACRLTPNYPLGG